MADLHDLLKQKDVLRDLEGWRVGKARAELRRSISVYQGNARELLVLLGEYRENHGTIATFDVTQPQGFERYLKDTQRLLHNYLAAAESLRLHIVRIHKAHLPPLPDDADSAEYDSRERETFGNPFGRFGRDLRHHFLKELIPMADGYLQWGMDPAYRKSDIRLDRTALLAERPGWSEPAKTYIDRCGDDISINEFVVEHRERISAFCKWFDEAVVRRNQRALQEFIDRTEAVDRAMRDAWGPPLEDPVGTPFSDRG